MQKIYADDVEITVLLLTIISKNENGELKYQRTAKTRGKSGIFPARRRHLPSAPAPKRRSTPQRRVVHLDLKGAPPTISYLERLLPLLRGAGATSLLVEYEDMFPYEGELRPASAANAYTPAQVRHLLDLAAQAGLEVVPLVQTFGHLEHVLKLPDFARLREDEESPESVCPSKAESLRLVKAMVDQVVATHAGHRAFSGLVHVGCDEVFHLASCRQCQSRLRRLGNVGRGNNGSGNNRTFTKIRLFLEHVKSVAQHVRTAHNATALVWDDMLRGASAEELQESGIGQLVEPVIWDYGERVGSLGAQVWKKYASVFGRHLWAASAFKGAFGEHLLLPVAGRHLLNNRAWTELMWREGRAGTASSNGRHRAGFRGLVLTGWSRYDHFAVLCELLPASVPSLLLNLISVSHPNSERERERAWREVMSCKDGKTFADFVALAQSDEEGEGKGRGGHAASAAAAAAFDRAANRCDFPGRDVHDLALRTDSVRSAVRRLLSEEGGGSSGVGRGGRAGGWLTEYNVRRNFTSVWRVREMAAAARATVEDLRKLQAGAKQVLEEVFDQHTVRTLTCFYLLPCCVVLYLFLKLTGMSTLPICAALYAECVLPTFILRLFRRAGRK